jgi:mannose-6-phosphate isomerase-like protein (cupin superfamily)
MLDLLFENIKVYGRYVKTNGLNGTEYWNKIESFLSRPEQKEGLRELDKIIGREWKIEVELSSGKKSSNIKEIYEFVHGEDGLKIYGEEGEKESKSLEHGVWEQNHFFLQLVRIPKNNELCLIRLLHVAYNLGQLSVYLEKENFSSGAINYFKSNNLDKLDAYIKLNSEQIEKIETNISITDLIANTNSFILEQMNLIQTGGGEELEPFYSSNVAELTKENNNYRRVLYTGANQQFVLMSIPPSDDIKMEVHENHDQFIRIEEGEGKAIIGISTYELKDDSAFIVPAGSKHQIINTSKTKPLKLYTIYSPPEHPDKLVQSTNPDKSEPKMDEQIIIETDSEELVSPSIIKKQLKEIHTKSIQSGGSGIGLREKKVDYKKKYNEYKNKYITLKKFISKYY